VLCPPRFFCSLASVSPPLRHWLGICHPILFLSMRVMFGVVLAPRGCTYTDGVGDWDRSLLICIWAREKEWAMRVLRLDGVGLSGGEQTMRMYGGGVGVVSEQDVCPDVRTLNYRLS
jgi:hypothetical protein